MDILQQSLQAADILSGDDNDNLFEELGLTFNTSVDSAQYTTDLGDLSTQANASYSAVENLGLDESQQSSFIDYSDDFTTQNFDTSQFLNKTATLGVNEKSTTSDPQLTSFVQPDSLQNANANNSLSGYGFSPSSQSSVLQLTDQTNFCHDQFLSSPQTENHSKASTSYVESSPVGERNALSNQESSFYQSAMQSISTVSIAEVHTAATCNSVFSRVPTQAISTSVQGSLNSAGESNHTLLPAGIRIASQNSFQPVTNLSEVNSENSSTPSQQNNSPVTLQNNATVQIVQHPNSEASHQNSRQLISLLQKPIIHASLASNTQSAVQVVNGVTVQQQTVVNTVNQNKNVLLRVPGGKHINISDPQIVKALTGNLVQKQQLDLQQSQQQSQQQFIKLGQNNAFINVSQRPSQPQVVQKPQQVTLQNGQTILLNTGQVQVGSQAQQLQIVQKSPAQTIAGASLNTQQTSRNGQLPITRIQIASVNIPIVSSNIVTSVSNSFIAVPVQAKQDLGTDTNSSSDTSSAQANRVVQLPNTASIRNILSGSKIPKSAASTNVTTQPHNQSQTIGVNGQVENKAPTVQKAQVGPTLRLNLTPQQASQLTTAQLQTILKQHQASMQARALIANKAEQGQQVISTPAVVAVSKPIQHATASTLTNILQTSTTNTSNAVVKPVTVSKPVTSTNEQGTNIQLYRVDPTLTEAQVDEVKRLLTNRTIGSKIASLTREQQQLFFAFRAQIKTMSPPVQQYYLRNPQLFMQKVMQKVRNGKPFILQVRSDGQQNKPKVVVPAQTKSLHPTISLTQDTNRGVKRIGSPMQLAVASTQAKSPVVRAASPTVVKSAISLPSSATISTVTVPKRPVKRHAVPDPPQIVSLVLEQLECHKKLVTHVDCMQPFHSVRDAIRRLVPFHTCHIPDIPEENFHESEKMFDDICDSITSRSRAMINKYHLLCLRDSTRDSCSAEMVMIERMFLQKEKAKFAEDKERIKENPALIKEYLPHHKKHREESLENTEVCDNVNSADSSNPRTTVELSYEHDAQEDSPLYAMNTSVQSPLSYGNEPKRTNRHSTESFSSQKSPLSLSDTPRARKDSTEEVLLREAVHSILL